MTRRSKIYFFFVPIFIITNNNNNNLIKNEMQFSTIAISKFNCCWKTKTSYLFVAKKKEEKIFHSYLYVCLFVQKKLYYIN